MSISIFDKNSWSSLLPKELTIVTDNGTFTLKLPKINTVNSKNSGPTTAVSVVGDIIQISYSQNTTTDSNDDIDVLKDGEPDTLEFDIHMVKTNDGTEANPDNLKLNVNLTYGDVYTSKFTISKPGEVKVVHYSGFGSKFDKETEFGFEDNSLKDLVTFFNRFGFQLDTKDFTFIDKDKDSYVYTETTKYIKNYERFRIKK